MRPAAQSPLDEFIPAFDARERYADLRTESERYIRDKPVQAVLTAFGVGLFVGLILRR